MKDYQYNYDVFPLVFPINRPTEITVKPLGFHARFAEDCAIAVLRLDAGSPKVAFTSWNKTDCPVTRSEDGSLHITYTAEAEGEYFIRVFENGKRSIQFPVYALEPDLAERLPFRGDFHMHTCRSDGHEDPGTVCANYRKWGYDFATITDHSRYYPSLEAIRVYRDARIPLTILPGEEVHLSQTNVHIVNAGGVFSVNGLLDFIENYRETNGSDEGRRLDETVDLPPVRHDYEYDRELEEIEKTLDDCPADVDKRSFAVCLWAFDKIRQAGGLSVFAHPYWIQDVFHIPEPFVRYMMKKHPFDAFEVLGGESYFHQNGLQTALYYDEYREGRVHPIVGSTDTHGSTDENRNAAICSTIVFAKANERTAIIDAVRNRYSVAVDTISSEYRLVGELRYQHYGAFLMENWYPIHDRLAAWDGELMRQYYVGDCTAEELSAASHKIDKLFEKYFVR